jgi:tRNA A22 N-methylase
VEEDDPFAKAKVAFSKLAKRGKSRKRFGHLVELACLCDKNKVRSIADIGCDHGLLSLELAVSGRFDRVVGIDVSEKALTNGAIALFDQMMIDMKIDDQWKDMLLHELNKMFPIEFCVGDGLLALESGQADAICIAGLGVDSLMRILSPPEIERVGCKYLILQPTNTRPRNLIRLYDFLADTGWTVQAERIEYLSSRWYISSLFSKEASHVSMTHDNDTVSRLPGQLLCMSDEASTRTVFRDYALHHQRWTEQDSKNAEGSMDENDQRWLKAMNGQDHIL